MAVPPDTPKAELEAVLAKLDAHKAEWAAMPLPKKAAMFRACMQTTIEVRPAPSSVSAALTSAAVAWRSAQSLRALPSVCLRLLHGSSWCLCSGTMSVRELEIERRVRDTQQQQRDGTNVG